MQKTISIIVFLAIFTVIRAQDNTRAVEDPSENEANDLSLLNKYKMLLKKMLNYGVPFFEGKKSREEIIKYFHDYPSTSRPSYLNHNTTVKKTKENSQKDKDDIRKASILLNYNKYLENLIKYGIKVLNPNKASKSENPTNKGRVQYNDDDAGDYNKYLDKYKIPGSNPNEERYTTSKGRPLFIAEFSTSKGRAQYQERLKK